MEIKKILPLFILSFFALSSFTLAQTNMLEVETPSTNTTPTTNSAEEEEEEAAFQVSGFVDVYYQFNFNENPVPTSFTETQNSFTPGMANVVLAREGKVGFVADLAVGPRAEVANGYSGTTLSAIKQLFVTYSPTDQFTFTLGNFGTHVGYEVIDAPANINYSTSYMFSNGPFYHTGLKLDYALTDKFGLMLGVFNDTDTKVDEVSGKHFGAQISYSDDNVGIFLNYIGGKDDEFLSDSLELKTTGQQIDLTATFQINDALGLGVNATSKMSSYTEGDDTSWFGAALYANYALSENFTLGFRGEYIGDPDGEILGIADNSIIDLTLSGNISIGPLTLIPEFRVDISDQAAFLDADGMATESSPTFIMAAVYAF